VTGAAVLVRTHVMLFLPLPALLLLASGLRRSGPPARARRVINAAASVAIAAALTSPWWFGRLSLLERAFVGHLHHAELPCSTGSSPIYYLGSLFWGLSAPPFAALLLGLGVLGGAWAPGSPPAARDGGPPAGSVGLLMVWLGGGLLVLSAIAVQLLRYVMPLSQRPPCSRRSACCACAVEPCATVSSSWSSPRRRGPGCSVILLPARPLLGLRFASPAYCPRGEGSDRPALARSAGERHPGAGTDRRPRAARGRRHARGRAGAGRGGADARALVDHAARAHRASARAGHRADAGGLRRGPRCGLPQHRPERGDAAPPRPYRHCYTISFKGLARADRQGPAADATLSGERTVRGAHGLSGLLQLWRHGAVPRGRADRARTGVACRSIGGPPSLRLT